MLSMKKHALSGHALNNNHFTGKQKTGSRRKQKLTTKEKRAKMNTHVNKFKLN